MVIMKKIVITLIVCLNFTAVLHAQDSVLFLETFDDDALPGWIFTDDPQPRQGPSDWKVETGELLQRSNIWSYDPPAEFLYHLGTHASFGNDAWTDYSLNAILRSSDNDGIGLLFRYQDPGNYYRILLMNDAGNSGSVNSPIQRIQKFVNGEPQTLLQNVVPEAYPAGYFALSVDVRSDTLRAYLNGELLGEVIDSQYESGKAGLMTYANTGAVFDSVMVSQDPHIYPEPDREVQYPVVQDRLPYIQHPQQDRVRISWRSLEAVSGSIAYGPVKGNPAHVVQSDSSYKKHSFVLENLVPNTRYYYTVFNGNDTVVEDASFLTAKLPENDTLSFFVLGDSGTGNQAQEDVRDALITNYNEDAVDLLLHVGDVHQQAGDEYDSVHFDVYQPLLQELGFFAAIGNHDTYTDNGGPFLDSFYPPGTNGHPDGRYYWHSWGNSFFLNIDTNIDFTEGSPQYDFIVEALNSPERAELDWTFVYFHHPPYTEYWPQWDGDKRVRDYLVPLFEAQGVDMVFNGHTHSYERGMLGRVHYIVSGGGGGNLDPFGRDFAHVDFSVAEHHFLRLDVTGLKLQMTAIDASGSVFDTIEINKEQPVALRDAPERPAEIDLYQNYPNPFNPATRIRYKLPAAGPIKLSVYNVNGQQVRVLYDGFKEAGTHFEIFDAAQLSSGIYMYKLEANGRTLAEKMLLLK
jgi:predicted phosphodiesterase